MKSKGERLRRTWWRENGMGQRRPWGLYVLVGATKWAQRPAEAGMGPATTQMLGALLGSMSSL